MKRKPYYVVQTLNKAVIYILFTCPKPFSLIIPNLPYTPSYS